MRKLTSKLLSNFYVLLWFVIGFPNVIGCIDGLLITIRKFKQNIKDYISHRNKPEINVMVRKVTFLLKSLEKRYT